MIKQLKAYLLKHNLRHLEISAPDHPRGLFEVSSSFWNGECWMGAIARGYTLEAAFKDFERQLEWTPIKERQGDTATAEEVITPAQQTASKPSSETRGGA